MGSRQRLLRCVYGLFGLHLALIAATAWICESAPVTDFHITTRKDGVLVFGRNRIGILAVKHFADWASAVGFLEKRQVALPIITHSEPQMVRELKLEGLLGEKGFKVVWNDTHRKAVFFAPDFESAFELASFIRYQSSRIQASPFGISLALD